MLAKGTKVTQIVQAPIKGEIAGYNVDQETGDLLLKVEWDDADGSVHTKYFKENEIRLDKAE